MGAIPPDAFVAAEDETGQNIYIGQAYYEDGLIVGELRKGDQGSYISPPGVFNKTRVPTLIRENIKV